MTHHPIFAANWKMNHAPPEARTFVERFLALVPERTDRAIWFFPPAVSLATVAGLLTGRSDVAAGAQNVHWEPKGAFTGETSAAMVRACGGAGGLVGHSERRHLFGETDSETELKVRALVGAKLRPFLCVGETLEQRERGETDDVVRRQLGAVFAGPGSPDVEAMVVAYEPVWAIGTGRTATPADAAAVHRVIRRFIRDRGVASRIPILYGGSVTPTNVDGLLAEDEIDGVLVGGASLDPETWARIVTSD